MKQRAQSNNAGRAAASATDARGWRLTIRGPSRTHSFMYPSTQPFGSRLSRQAYRPLGAPLSGPTPEVAGLRSGLQSRTGSIRCLPVVPCIPSRTALQLMFLPQQLLTPVAPTRRSAILAHGLPSLESLTQACDYSGLALAHVSSCHRPLRRAQACQQRTNSNRPRRSPATDRLRTRTAPIPAAFQQV